VIERLGSTLPFTGEQAFDIAADIERYPEFLPGWHSARINRREANIFYVEQEVGLGPLRWRFASTAVLHRPERIDVTSTDDPFKRFSLSWDIATLPFTRCQITVAATVEMQSSILQIAVNQLLRPAVDDALLAFESRAYALYTASTDPPKPPGAQKGKYAN
jgi:coenzyme Q-binding protein COQ10